MPGPPRHWFVVPYGRVDFACTLRGTPISTSHIELRGVRVHNLRNVDVDIPRGVLVAVCGVSGSGKTSLAMDTLYAEGQRRYIESFSAYTRQFLERLDKPDYDRIDGLPPALAVARGSAPRGNRSTVGTASETLDYLRLLFSKIANLVCYRCGAQVQAEDSQSVAQRIAAIPQGKRLMLAFRTGWDDVADRAAVLAGLQADGFVRLIAEGQQFNLGQTDREQLAGWLPAVGEALVVVDRLRGGDEATRTSEAIETAFEHGDGRLHLLLEADSSDEPPEQDTTPQGPKNVILIDGQQWQVCVLSGRYRCDTCDLDYPDPEPRLFSFNSPLGACPQCEGFGDTIDLDLDLILPDRNKPLREGAIAPWSTPAYEHHLDGLLDIADELGIDPDVPVKHLTKAQLRLLLNGVPEIGFGGLEGFFQALERKKYKMHVRVFLSRWRSYNRCSQCDGARLNPLALSFRVGENNLAQWCSSPISEVRQWLVGLDLPPRQRAIARVPAHQLAARLDYLQRVGLGYLTLDRTLRTLSGGEAQRTALTAALGSSLVNMLYVLDEPSVGLHPHDVHSLVDAIEGLAHRGNTVVMIEHEPLLLERAEWLIEVGPAAGAGGGQIVFSGDQSKLREAETLTGDYLSGKRRVPISGFHRKPRGSIEITGCDGHNLKSIDVEIPLGILCLVTGVSGCGKSTLVQDTLYGALAQRLTGKKAPSLKYRSLRGAKQLKDCILVDQTPVSRSPRSNPVTYVKAFDDIRAVFADSFDARARNLTAGHFSFNAERGRCPQCNGDGELQIDMQFLADIHMTCPSCHGTRYRNEILQVRYRDQNIADVLKMTVREAQSFFRGEPKVQQKLQVLADVGLDYLQLGQAATTLSSGEAQRLKLASHLANASRKATFFILDEPSTGLHTHDLVRLLACFDALLEAGHSLLVVEHNLQLIAAADHIIDLGPGPADAGGEVVASGTPRDIAAHPDSLTGKYLQSLLG